MNMERCLATKKNGDEITICEREVGHKGKHKGTTTKVICVGFCKWD